MNLKHLNFSFILFCGRWTWRERRCVARCTETAHSSGGSAERALGGGNGYCAPSVWSTPLGEGPRPKGLRTRLLFSTAARLRRQGQCSSGLFWWRLPPPPLARGNWPELRPQPPQAARQLHSRVEKLRSASQRLRGVQLESIGPSSAAPPAALPPLRLGPNEPTKQQRGPVRWPGRQADRQVTQTDRPADRNGRRNSRFPAGAARLQGRLSRMTHRSSGCLPCDSQALRRVSWQAGGAGRLALAGRGGAGRQAGRGTSPSLCSGEINPIPPKRTERKGATPSRSRGRGRRVSRSGVGGIVKRREKLRGASVGGRAAECVIMQNRVPEDRRR